MIHPSRCVPVSLALLIAVSSPSLGFLRPGGSRDPSLRAWDRASQASPAARRGPDPSQRAALARLRHEVPALSVTWDPARGTPSFIRAAAGLVTFGPGRPAEAVRDFLRKHCALFRGCAGALEVAEASPERTEADGTTRVALTQRIGGREVFRAGLAATFDASGRLVSLAANVVPELRPGPAPRFEAGHLVSLALQHVGADGRAGAVRTTHRSVAYALDGEARPAEFVWVRGGDLNDLVVVDAADGSLLMRSHVMMYTQPQGKVFERAPNDLQDPNISSPVQPTLVPFTGDPVASPIGWVTDNPVACEETAGNNVFLASYWGVEAGAGFFNLFPCEEGAHFEYPWARDYTDCSFKNFTKRIRECHQVGQDPLLAGTNLFYHTNRIHDVLFSLGFDESWGNFQEVNFGGDPNALGGDAIEILSSGGVHAGLECNARFFPNPDGERAWIEMGMFSTDPNVPGCTNLRPRVRNVDSSLDPDIIYHEYGHGMSTRIVGIVSMDPGTSAGLLGEGWSDFIAIQILSDPAAPGDEGDPNRPFLYGGYEISGGGRRYPYSVDEGVNPLTFDNLCETGCRIHDDGEIWANMLWEVRYRLIQDHGFAVGKEKMGFLLVDSMKNLSGAGPPDMLTARDAILAADGVRYLAENCTSIWEAFTERGLGPAADFADPNEQQPLSDYGPLADSDGDGTIDICESGGGGGGGGSCGPDGCHTFEPKP